jgi:hypothetical protein
MYLLKDLCKFHSDLRTPAKSEFLSYGTAGFSAIKQRIATLQVTLVDEFFGRHGIFPRWGT